MMKHNAFSLVELSIVLVILGLLTGGILAGQSLIRAAELRGVSTDITRYLTASQTFRDKYFAIPGDMNAATKFWGDNNSACPTADANGTPGTCNGDGDGQVEHAPAVSVHGESFTFWQHLANAGLVEGSYTGIAGPSAAYAGRHAVLGQNVPRGKMSSMGYNIEYNGGTNFGTGATNYMHIGEPDPAGGPTWAPFLKSEEAWNIDTKVDDGKPGTGKLVSSESLVGTCVTTNVAATSQYKLDDTGKPCHLYLVHFL